jgi:hypothetical protein
MAYIVKLTGFYGGTHYKAGQKHQDIPDAVARPFAAPYGNQLEKVEDRKPAPKAAAVKDQG